MPRPNRDPAVRRRDAALLRLRRAKQALTACALLGAGIVGTAAARSFPGHSRHHVATVTGAEANAGRSMPSQTSTHHATGTASHAHRRLRDARERRARAHHTAARFSTASTTSTSTSQATTTSPAPPATTPAPAASTSAGVTSGGS